MGPQRCPRASTVGTMDCASAAPSSQGKGLTPPAAADGATRTAPARAPQALSSAKAAMADAVQDMDFLSMVTLAQEHGAKVVNVRASGLYKLTPLHMAVRQGKMAYVRVLVHHDADLQARDWSNWTPLMYTARFAPGVSKTRDGVEDTVFVAMARLLVRSGADVNAHHCFGTALHICAERNNLELAKVLLEHGADVNDQHSLLRKSPLHVAVMRRSMDVAELLLAAGASVDCRDEHDLTPLNYAAKFERVNFIALLLDYGVDAND
jgi:ankyrin repeat protein